jgi:hypothetical protein
VVGTFIKTKNILDIFVQITHHKGEIINLEKSIYDIKVQEIKSEGANLWSNKSITS